MEEIIRTHRKPEIVVTRLKKYKIREVKEVSGITKYGKPSFKIVVCTQGVDTMTVYDMRNFKLLRKNKKYFIRSSHGVFKWDNEHFVTQRIIRKTKTIKLLLVSVNTLKVVEEIFSLKEDDHCVTVRMHEVERLGSDRIMFVFCHKIHVVSIPKKELLCSFKIDILYSTGTLLSKINSRFFYCVFQVSDRSIGIIDIEKKKIVQKMGKHQGYIYTLDSYIDEEGYEIVVAGGCGEVGNKKGNNIFFYKIQKGNSSHTLAGTYQVGSWVGKVKVCKEKGKFFLFFGTQCGSFGMIEAPLSFPNYKILRTKDMKLYFYQSKLVKTWCNMLEIWKLDGNDTLFIVSGNCSYLEIARVKKLQVYDQENRKPMLSEMEKNDNQERRDFVANEKHLFLFGNQEKEFCFKIVLRNKGLSITIMKTFF